MASEFDDLPQYMKGAKKAQFFVSIKLNGQCSGEAGKLLSRYDTASPWCLPACFTAKKCGNYAIYINFSELPDFHKMEDFYEFKKE